MSVNIRLKPPNQNSIFELYHTHSKRHPHHFRTWETTPPDLHEDSVISRWMESSFKPYQCAPKRGLPDPEEGWAIKFSDAFQEVINTPVRLDMLSIQEVSSLLYYSAGLNQEGIRPYASASSHYSLEVYLEKIEAAENGIYHYQPRNHFLEHIATEIPEEKSPEGETTQGGTVFYITGIFERSVLRYGERGYRYVLVEAGQVIQNFYLVSRAMGLCAASTGEFLDDRLHRRLNIDGVEEALLFMVTIGRTS